MTTPSLERGRRPPPPMWPRIAATLYWDRAVSYPDWLRGMAAAHPSYFRAVAESMPPRQFMDLYGRKRFIRDWPAIRTAAGAGMPGRLGLFDALWSHEQFSNYSVKPLPKWATMPKRRRQFLLTIARNPGISIYRAAKASGLQYRRAHDHARQLLEDGFVQSRAKVEGGRCSVALYPY